MADGSKQTGGKVTPQTQAPANTGTGQAGQVKPANIENVVRPPAPGGSGGKGK